MKANELMVNDWVTFTAVFSENDKEIRSTQIEDIITKDIWDILHLRNWPWNVFASDVEPIPLTEEILKANEFEIDEICKDGDIVYRHKNIDFNSLNCIKYNGGDGFQFTISKDKDEFQGNSVFVRCKFVHELQHALHLCGLNELTDNFKIKSIEE